MLLHLVPPEAEDQAHGRADEQGVEAELPPVRGQPVDHYYPEEGGSCYESLWNKGDEFRFPQNFQVSMLQELDKFAFMSAAVALWV